MTAGSTEPDGTGPEPVPGGTPNRSPSGTPGGTGDLSIDRIATIPNLLSAIRILLIPVFVVLILDEDTQAAGLILLVFTLATDWVDGFIARRTGQVSNLGKILDPVADRLAIAAGLIALVIAGGFPLWAALLILVRDLAVLVGGAIVAARWHVRIDVRWIGKAATLFLMCAIPTISWATFDLPLGALLLIPGWISYGIGLVLYYAAAAMYATDMRRAIASSDAA